MKVSELASYGAQRFASLGRRFSLNQLRVACHRQLSKRRNQRGKEEYTKSILVARGIEGIRQTFYSGVGVGVYQGEMVIIQKWVFLKPHQWVIGKFQALDSHLFQRDTVCKLLQTALILAHYLQSDVGMNHSQNPVEMRLLNDCPHAKRQKSDEDTFSKECESAECPLQRLIAKKQMPLLRQYSPEAPRCPFEGIINLLSEGLNQSGKEPATAVS
jgi:hypothetical protein